ncbi:hypothetical protein BBJ28_00007732 [Nothophytophthora sp. Chile5]|nr:hypothetical protein BBJ28_00007732 [Nothophytophthora sp. Chile5]
MERSSAHATRAAAAVSASSTSTASTNDPTRKRKRGALQDISNNSKKLTQSRVSTRRGSSGVVKKDRRSGVAVTNPRTRAPLRSSTRSAASSTVSTANSSVNTTLSSSMASSTTSKSTAKKRSSAVPLKKTELATKKRKHDAAGLENQPPHQKVQTSMLSFQATKTTATRISRVGLRNATGRTVDPLVPATSSATVSDAKASLKPTTAKVLHLAIYSGSQPLVEPQQLAVKSDAVMSGVEEQVAPVKDEVAEQEDEPMLPTLAEIEAMPSQPGEYVPRPYKFTFDHRNSGFDEQTYAASVHDIDTPSDSMSSHCAKLVREMDAYHRKHETKYLPEVDYIGTVQTDINEKMRTILIDWLVEVGEEYDLDSQTFHKAIKINRKQFQLLGCACMMVAAKFEEVYGPNVEEFVYISDQTYTAEEVPPSTFRHFLAPRIGIP